MASPPPHSCRFFYVPAGQWCCLRHMERCSIFLIFSRTFRLCTFTSSELLPSTFDLVASCCTTKWVGYLSCTYMSYTSLLSLEESAIERSLDVCYLDIILLSLAEYRCLCVASHARTLARVDCILLHDSYKLDQAEREKNNCFSSFILLQS